MIITLGTLFGFLFSYFPTLVFLMLKWGWLTRDGCRYNWGGDLPHTLLFLFIVSLDSVKFLFIMRWKLGLFR